METWIDQNEQRVCAADDADAEIARLTAEVGRLSNVAIAAANLEAHHGMLVADLDSSRMDVARLTAERDAERAGRERAERVAVWAVKRGAYIGNQSGRILEDPGGEGIGTDADLFRALVEACEGGRDHG